MVTFICIGLQTVLIFLLGFSVSMARGKYAIVIGCPSDPEHNLHKLIRAHANTTEYVPALIVMMYILSLNELSTWLYWAFIVVTACRYLYVVGMLLPRTMNKPNPMRFIGTLGTYVVGIGMSVEIIRLAL